MGNDRATRAIYVISVPAELSGVHPQTLRVYERKGLLDPSRTSGGSRRFSEEDLDRLRPIHSLTPTGTSGGSRRFSEEDLDRLRHIQSLTTAGLNLEGVRRVMELEDEVARLEEELVATRAEAREAVAVTHRQYRRELVPLRQHLVPTRPARHTA